MSLKNIEKGILDGDWSKVVKGFNAITGKKLKIPAKSNPTPTKTKTISKIVYKNPPELKDIIEFYSDKVNYGVVGTSIPILIDGGEKARESKQFFVDNEVAPKNKTKKTPKKSKKDDVLVIDDGEEESLNYLKKAVKRKEYREPDDSKTLIEYKCSKCGRSKMFRKFETERYVGDHKMDVVCNSCISGG